MLPLTHWIVRVVVRDVIVIVQVNLGGMGVLG
jgi:hypothetical protein